jgi:hypothetical protein
MSLARLAFLSIIAAYLVLLGAAALHLIDAWTDVVLASVAVAVMAVAGLAIMVTQLVSWVRHRQS